MTTPAALLTTIAGVAAAGALVLAGCGDEDDSTSTTTSTTTSPSRTVDAAQVESGIETQLSTPAAEVSSVKCPDDVKAEAGATLSCSVTRSNGATGKVKVTQESLNQFAYEPVSGSVQMPGSAVEKSIEQELDKQGAQRAGQLPRHDHRQARHHCHVRSQQWAWPGGGDRDLHIQRRLGHRRSIVGGDRVTARSGRECHDNAKGTNDGSQ